MNESWRTGGIEAGDMVRLDDGEFESRLGHGWARGRLKHGDVLVALAHAGDCFFLYQLVDASQVLVDGEAKLHLEPIGAPIGAYTVGRPIGSLDRETLTEIANGGEVTIPMPELHRTPASDRRTETPVRTLGDVLQELRTLSPGMLESPVSPVDESGRPSPGAWIDVDHARSRASLRDGD